MTDNSVRLAEDDPTQADWTMAQEMLAQDGHVVTSDVREALQIAASMVDTPIARRRLNIDGNDERLVVIRAALSAQPAPVMVEAEAAADGLDDFIEEWSDCGNLGWCHREGQCTRHNPDEYRAALKALSRASNEVAPADGGEGA